MKAAGEKTPLKSRLLGCKRAVTRHLPRWSKRPFRIVYEHGLTTAWGIRRWIKNRRSRSPLSYEERINEEIADGVRKFQSHRDGAPLYEPAPPSWDYVEAATRQLIREQTGFNQWEYVVHQANQIEAPEILSLGTGSCGIEIGLAEGMTTSYRFHCIDLNDQILALGKKEIDKRGLNITVQAMDLNRIVLNSEKYHIITAFASLHHLIELERVYSAIENALKPDGKFVVVDVITKNGIRMWPETEEAVRQIWAVLPDKYKVNHTRYEAPRFTPRFSHKDCSADSFEGIRSQDVLPLIPEYFDPVLYVPCHSICRQLLDTQYGPNYDLNDPLDRSTVEFIWNLDCYYVRERILPPGTMFAVMSRKGRGDRALVAEVSRRMLADSRARQKGWNVPPLEHRINFAPSTERRSTAGPKD